MLGRGILANPGLINVIKNNINTSKNILKDFHDEILNRYIEVFPEDTYAINRMKELFGYMIYIFSDNKEYVKKIRSAQKLSDYTEAVQSLFTEQEIIKEAGLFYNKQ